MIDASVSECAPVFTCLHLEDIYQHWLLAVRTTRAGYIEHQEMAEIIKSYTLSNDCNPLIVTGDTGSGKTSFFATIAQQVTLSSRC